MQRHNRARDLAVPIAGLFFISLCLVFAAVTASAQETTSVQGNAGVGETVLWFWRW